MSLRNYLTSHEVNTLLHHVRNGANAERNHCMLLMAFVHGLRASELLNLRLSDLDIEGRSLYIRRLKNGFSTIHPLISDEVTSVKRWLKIRATLRDASLSHHLFISDGGRPLTRQWFYSIIRLTGTRAELPVPTHPHMLRHACGYALADAGVDTRLIQDYLGHKNIRHTVLYTASNPARFKGIWERHQKNTRASFSTKLLTMHSMWN